jgi:lipoprotein-releasing system permease protein|tara:strand:- start:4032 stop:5222 length:1191 start_codon:yes stop_codon:yes gene_type:complete
MRYLFLLAYRFLIKRKGSMFTASAAVGATIFLIIFNSVVLGGVVHGVTRDLGDMTWGHISIYNEKGLLERPDDQIIGHVLRDPAVVGAAPRTFATIKANHTLGLDSYSLFGIRAMGVDPIRELSASRLHDSIQEGEFLRHTGSAVIDDEVAKGLNATVGSYIQLKSISDEGPRSFRWLRVVGIFDVPGPTLLDETVIMHQTDLREMMKIKKNYSHEIIVRLRNTEETESVKKWIENSYLNDNDLNIETVDERGRVVITAYREGIQFVNILAYSGMMASSLGVITIMMMIVNSKVREIGILRSIGLTEGQVLIVFMIDGAILGVLGTIFGAIGGTLISLYLAQNPVALFSGLVPEVRFTLDALPIPMLVGFAMSVIASTYPAWRASRYQPEEAMRYV